MKEFETPVAIDHDKDVNMNVHPSLAKDVGKRLGKV